jgi:integrase
LDRKAGSDLWFSLVGHLRWDLRHIFRVAVAEGIIERNPGELLFTPQNATRAVRRVTAEEMARVFSALDLRERLILKLAGIAGMRPGEILALQ